MTKLRKRHATLSAVALLTSIGLATVSANRQATQPSTQPAAGGGDEEMRQLDGGTQVQVLQPAPDAPREAKDGDTLFVHYTGRLSDGTEFDSSLTRRGQFGVPSPLPVVLGTGGVIPGMENGLRGMKVGEKRRLVIPPEQGYGDRAVGPIPAGSTLEFDVELVGLYRE